MEISTPAQPVSLVEEGVRLTAGDAGDIHIEEIVFPAYHSIPPYEPERPYLVVVLTGALTKTFRIDAHDLRPASVVTMPAGARHATRFGASEARVVLLKPAPAAEERCGGLFRSLRDIRDETATAIGWRITRELRAGDAAWPLAAEGLALELLAALARRARPVGRHAKAPAWLVAARDSLHEDAGAPASLSDLAATVGVHPAHLSRVFRRHYGMTVGAYVRRLRLERVAAQLAADDESLAAIAARTGFADQSHLTRAFKAFAGMTPGRYREAFRASRRRLGEERS